MIRLGINLFHQRGGDSFYRSHFLTAFVGPSPDRVDFATTSPLFVASTSVPPEKIGSATISESFSSRYRFTRRPSEFRKTAT